MIPNKYREKIERESFPFAIDTDALDNAQSLMRGKSINMKNMVETLASLPLEEEELAYASFAFSANNAESVIMPVVAGNMESEDLVSYLHHLAVIDSFTNICTATIALSDTREHIVIYFMTLAQLTSIESKIGEMFNRLRMAKALEKFIDSDAFADRPKKS